MKRKQTVSPTQLRISLNNVFYGGLATSAMDTLAVGPFLIAYALLFGASNMAVGFLGAIGFIGNLTSLYAAYLIDHKHTPKRISVLFSAGSRPFYLIAAMLAFVSTQSWALGGCLFLLRQSIQSAAWRAAHGCLG